MHWLHCNVWPHIVCLNYVECLDNDTTAGIFVRYFYHKHFEPGLCLFGIAIGWMLLQERHTHTHKPKIESFETRSDLLNNSFIDWCTCSYSALGAYTNIRFGCMHCCCYLDFVQSYKNRDDHSQIDECMNNRNPLWTFCRLYLCTFFSVFRTGKYIYKLMSVINIFVDFFLFLSFSLCLTLSFVDCFFIFSGFLFFFLVYLLLSYSQTVGYKMLDKSQLYINKMNHPLKAKETIRNGMNIEQKLDQ